MHAAPIFIKIILISIRKACMKKNRIQNQRTLDFADEALSQVDNIINDVNSIFDINRIDVAPLFYPDIPKK